MIKIQGLLVSFVLGMLALLLGGQFPLLGSSLIAILLGIGLNNSVGVKENWQVGLAYAGKKLLQWAIIVLGFTFSISEVSEVGLSSLKLSVTTIVIAFLIAYFLGKALRMNQKLSLLVGFGTAICGGSAIAAASPILEADDEDIAMALSTIFLFNILAVFIFPFLGHVLHLSDQAFGLWAGTAINDTSSVVAAGYSYSQSAGDYATIVKLARALMIIPSCLLMVAIKLYQSHQQGVKVSLKQVFPWFILFFLLASVLSSLGMVPVVWFAPLKKISQLLMAMALVGIGSKVSLEGVKRAGSKPLILGLVTWLVIAVSSLVLRQYFF